MDERSAGRGEGPKLFMDGPEIFAFALKVVPATLNQLYALGKTDPDSIDLFIFHQANQYMLENLRRKLRIPAERFVIELADVGNTSSNTIPIALQRVHASGRIKPGQRIALVGFGVGLSWGAVLIDWR
jgi:3-oxoacyl-[acyl-carrier-protein] synthase-3